MAILRAACACLRETRRAHALDSEVFAHGAVAVGASLPARSACAVLRTSCPSDPNVALPSLINCTALRRFVEIVRRVQRLAFPLGPQPAEFSRWNRRTRRLFLLGIGVAKPQVGLAANSAAQAEIQGDTWHGDVADSRSRSGGKARVHPFRHYRLQIAR